MRFTNHSSLARTRGQEEIARRGSFWNGVVLYREKTLGGSLFRNSKKPAGLTSRTMRPLQLYVRRLEPLALHLTGNAFGITRAA